MAVPLMAYAQCQTNKKPNKLKVFGSKKTKGPKQDSQNLLRFPVPEG